MSNASVRFERFGWGLRAVALAADLPAPAPELAPEASAPPSAVQSSSDDGGAAQLEPIVAPAPVDPLVDGASEPAPRAGFVLQTRIAELSILVDQIAQDKIAARYPPGRIAELDTIMREVDRKTADGEMPTPEELEAERDWHAYGAFRDEIVSHAQALKGALLVASADGLEDIADGLHEGWPDVAE